MRSCAGARSCTIGSCCPHFDWADFARVIEDLRRAGYPFRAEWFAPFFEFRFPRVRRAPRTTACSSSCAGARALARARRRGDGAAAGAVRRFVARAAAGQVPRARSRAPSGRPATAGVVPLQPTGDAGEFVAGVRYRAWQAVFGLHPTIGAHAPLVFDVFDRRLGRVDRRLRLSRHPPGRPQLREVPRQRVRGGVSPHLALLGLGTHRRRGGSATVGESSSAPITRKRPSY